MTFDLQWPCNQDHLLWIVRLYTWSKLIIYFYSYSRYTGKFTTVYYECSTQTQRHSRLVMQSPWLKSEAQLLADLPGQSPWLEPCVGLWLAIILSIISLPRLNWRVLYMLYADVLFLTPVTVTVHAIKGIKVRRTQPAVFAGFVVTSITCGRLK